MPHPGEAALRRGAAATYTQDVPFDVGPWELVILLGALVLLFGGKGVPDAAKRLGTGLREMRNALGDVDPRRMLEPDEQPRKETRGTRDEPGA
jgi:sec-independent protein translocase protein TatA